VTKEVASRVISRKIRAGMTRPPELARNCTNEIAHSLRQRPTLPRHRSGETSEVGIYDHLLYLEDPAILRAKNPIRASLWRRRSLSRIKRERRESPNDKSARALHSARSSFFPRE